MSKSAAFGHLQLIRKQRNVNWQLRLIKYGCTNRRFFKIGVAKQFWPLNAKPVEVIGCHDPFENEHGEKITTINLDRVAYWMGRNCDLTPGVAHLLGLMGFFPIHPRTYKAALRAQIKDAVKEGLIEEPRKVIIKERERTLATQPREYRKKDGSEILKVEFDNTSADIKPPIVTRRKIEPDTNK